MGIPEVNSLILLKMIVVKYINKTEPHYRALLLVVF